MAQVTEILLLGVVLTWASLSVVHSAPQAQQAGVCRHELANANRTLAAWAEQMEQMVNESTLPASVRDSVHSEANRILDMIEEFGVQVGQPAVAPSSLSRDLVAIRRRANKMALDIYLNTFDMRWPQNSLHLGIIVERVQQACLDRAAIQALEASPDPLDTLAKSP